MSEFYKKIQNMSDTVVKKKYQKQIDETKLGIEKSAQEGNYIYTNKILFSTKEDKDLFNYLSLYFKSLGFECYIDDNTIYTGYEYSRTEKTITIKWYSGLEED